MTQTPTPEQPETQPPRAGIGVRLWGIVLSFFAAGLGLFGLFGMPDGCHFIGYVAAALFGPASGWMLFASLRGRKADLQALSGREMADTAATTAAGRVADEVIDKLM